MDTDVDRFVDEHGVKEYYRLLDEVYGKVEEILPTRFAEYERYNRSDYYKVRNNFYALFHLAEQLKKQIYGQVGRLRVTVGTRRKTDIGKDSREETGESSKLFLDKWKLSFREKTGLATRKELPDVTFNIFQIDLLLEGEVYGITRRFMEEMYETGRLNQFSFIKMTGQSYKMDLFKNALKEFVPEQFIIMPDMVKEMKYPSKNAPDFVITSLDSMVNFGFNVLPVVLETGDTKVMSRQFQNALTNVNPSIKIKNQTGDIATDQGNEMSWFDFKGYTLDGQNYNRMYIVKMKNTVLHGIFNCPMQLKDEWESAMEQCFRTVEENIHR